jgi:hypothetical protein
LDPYPSQKHTVKTAKLVDDMTQVKKLLPLSKYNKEQALKY